MRRIRKHIRTLIIVSIPFFTTLIVKAQQMLPYQNPQLSVEERVNDLLGRMTLEEKIGQITHLHSYKVFDGQELNPNKLEVYYIQPFVDSGNLLGSGISAMAKPELETLLRAVKPYIPAAYKLAAIRNEDGHFTPKIKLSENTEKVTNPGNKEIYRIYDKETGKIRADLICLANETFDENEDMVLFDPNETWKRTRIVGGTYTMRKLLVPIFEEGKCVYTSPSVMEIQSICTQEKATLWDENMRFVNPSNVYVDLSDNLYDLKQKVFNDFCTECPKWRISEEPPI